MLREILNAVLFIEVVLIFFIFLYGILKSIGVGFDDHLNISSVILLMVSISLIISLFLVKLLKIVIFK